MELKKRDLNKLEKAFFDHLRYDDIEYGGLGIDPKRPFGNSDVEGDILEDILEEKPAGDDGYGDYCWSTAQREYARKLYFALGDYLREKYGTGQKPSWIK